jgi:phosphohistidine phosphatase
MTKMQREIHLLRHAHAGDPASWSGDDALRPLSKKGRKQAEQLAAFLKQAEFRPDALVSSPKVRARHTAEIVGASIGAEVTLDDRVAEGFDMTALRDLVKEIDARRIVVVGHDPDFSELLAELIGAREMPMPKGALARIDYDGAPSPGNAVLRWLIPPDALHRAGAHASDD